MAILVHTYKTTCDSVIENYSTFYHQDILNITINNVQKIALDCSNVILGE